MLFNSLQFAVFLPVVFILYWFVAKGNRKVQNILLLVASYIFYGWWDWRFLGLLILLSTANYFIGIEIERNQGKKGGPIWFVTGLAINLGVLGVFKYYNFFIDSFIDLVSVFGYDLPGSTTKIVLPVGISFYTFLSLSYLIDIKRKSLVAHRSVVDVLLSLSFFPIILAGPIQRPASLLPQFAGKRVFNYNQAVDGLRQILWGLFTKVVIADNLAVFVDDYFINYSGYSGSTLLLGAIFYTIQIYADFSGYSDMAIGTAKLFGLNLMRNFAYPYFARDIAEFWKRWHISLVTWFRDYLFLPLSFAISWRTKSEKVLLIRTDFLIYALAGTVVWFLTGLWHGANYTFIVWGLIHGSFLIAYRWQMRPRKVIFKKLGISNNNRGVVITERIITLIIVIVAWIFFRADNIGHAINYLSGILSPALFSLPYLPDEGMAWSTIIVVIAFMIIEWSGREKQFPIGEFSGRWKRPARFAVYYVLIIAIFLFHGVRQQFIYFQF